MNSIKEYVNPIAQSHRLSDEENYLRVHVCKHTGTEVLYLKQDNGEKFCLHNEDIADDRWDVAEFRKTLP